MSLRKMRYAGRTNAEAIYLGFEVAKAGVTLAEVNEAIEQHILDAGCKPAFKGYQPAGASSPFPAAACISPNDVVVHGIPDDYAIMYGDLITIDVGTEYEGWFADSARSKVISAPLSLLTPRAADKVFDAERLVRHTETILHAQLARVRDGCTFLQLVEAAERMAAVAGIVLLPQFGGHYIGDRIHIDPFIPNAIDRTQSVLKQRLDTKKYEKQTLKAGETICIEPVTTHGSTVIMIDSDGWTVRKQDRALVAHTERCLLVTQNGYEILS